MGKMTIAEIQNLIDLTEQGFKGIIDAPSFKDPAIIPAHWRPTIASIYADLVGDTVTTTADVRKFLEQRGGGDSTTLTTRAQRLINAAVEGKGGGDFAGPPIKPGSFASRLVQHANALERIRKDIEG